MDDEYKVQVMDLIGDQLVALESEFPTNARDAASDVFFYLTDTRNTGTTPDVVWNALWRWMNISWNSDGEMQVGSDAVRQEIGAIWRETLEKSGAG